MNRQDMEDELHTGLSVLQTDYTDSYFNHRGDAALPVGEVPERMEGLRRSG